MPVCRDPTHRPLIEQLQADYKVLGDKWRQSEAENERLRAALKEAGNRADDIGASHLAAFIDAALEQKAAKAEPYPDEPAEVTIRRDRSEWDAHGQDAEDRK